MNSEYPLHSTDIESTLLGLLMDATESEMLEGFVSKYPDAKHYFYDDRHRVVYNAIMSLHGSTTPVNQITVSQALAEAGHLKSVGGWNYLSTCYDAYNIAGIPGNYSYYADKLKDLYGRRRVIKAAAKIHADACSKKSLIACSLDR